jgi:hypothetical protein
VPDLTPPTGPKAEGDSGHVAVHEQIRQAITALDNHGHPIAEVTGLQAALDGKAATSHAHTIATITGLQAALDAKVESSALAEIIEDTLGAKIVAGANVGVVYDDTAGTVTITASGGGGGGGLDDAGVAALFATTSATREAFEDRLAAILTAGSNVSISYNDSTGAVTVAVTGLGTAAALDVAPSGNASATQVVKGNDSRLSDARTPSAHGHATSEVTGLDAALAGKAATGHTHATTAVPIPFSTSGELAVATGAMGVPWYGGARTLQRLAARVGTAPTGAALVLALKKNGATVATLSVAAGSLAAQTTTFSDATIADGDYLTLDVTQVGSTVKGSNLVASVWVG